MEGSSTIWKAALRELEAGISATNPKLDQLAAMKVADRYSDPELGKGLQRLTGIEPKFADKPVVAALADSMVVP